MHSTEHSTLECCCEGLEVTSKSHLQRMAAELYLATHKPTEHTKLQAVRSYQGYIQECHCTTMASHNGQPSNVYVSSTQSVIFPVYIEMNKQTSDNPDHMCNACGH